MQNSAAGVDVPELLARLQAFALGDDPNAMTDAEIAASISLLDYVMPDLAEIEVNVRRKKRYIAGTNSIT